MTVIGLAVPVAVPAEPFPGVHVALYPVIARPPLPPAVKATVSCVTPCCTDEMVGADGVVAGVTETVPDAGDVPTEFFAFTEQL